MVVHCIYSQIGVVGQRAKSNGKRGEEGEGGLTGSTKNEEGSREEQDGVWKCGCGRLRASVAGVGVSVVYYYY